MSVQAIHPARRLVPPSDVVARVRAGPTAADLRLAHGLIAPFIAQGSARFPLASLLGDCDAVATIEYLQHVMPCMPTARGAVTPLEVRIAYSALLMPFGNWLAKIMTAHEALNQSQGTTFFDSVLLRFMRNGSAAYYSDEDGPLSFHCDYLWGRVILHVCREGTLVRIREEEVEQLKVGELLLLSGGSRLGVPPTFHCAPATTLERGFAVFDFFAEFRVPRGLDF